MASWEDWAQQIGGALANSAINAKYTQPYELQKLQLQAYANNPNSPLYTVGQPNVTTGIPAGWLLIGGAVLVAVVMMKS